jgi:hypothetical protein
MDRKIISIAIALLLLLVAVPSLASAESIIFVSDAEVQGRIVYPIDASEPTLVGIDAADAICQSEATAAGLNGKYIAFLSTGLRDVKDRLSNDIFKNTAGEIIAGRRAELFDGDIDAAILTLDGAPISTGVWTGSNSLGMTAAFDCADWTAIDRPGSIFQPDGYRGHANRQNAEWINYGMDPCKNLQHLYCIQVPLQLNYEFEHVTDSLSQARSNYYSALPSSFLTELDIMYSNELIHFETDKNNKYFGYAMSSDETIQTLSFNFQVDQDSDIREVYFSLAESISPSGTTATLRPFESVGVQMIFSDDMYRIKPHVFDAGKWSLEVADDIDYLTLPDEKYQVDIVYDPGKYVNIKVSNNDDPNEYILHNIPITSEYDMKYFILSGRTSIEDNTDITLENILINGEAYPLDLAREYQRAHAKSYPEARITSPEITTENGYSLVSDETQKYFAYALESDFVGAKTVSFDYRLRSGDRSSTTFALTEDLQPSGTDNLFRPHNSIGVKSFHDGVSDKYYLVPYVFDDNSWQTGDKIELANPWDKYHIDITYLDHVAEITIYDNLDQDPPKIPTYTYTLKDDFKPNFFTVSGRTGTNGLELDIEQVMGGNIDNCGIRLTDEQVSALITFGSESATYDDCADCYRKAYSYDDVTASKTCYYGYIGYDINAGGQVRCIYDKTESLKDLPPSERLLTCKDLRYSGEYYCHDGKDNDNDNLIDCADEDCDKKLCAEGLQCKFGVGCVLDAGENTPYECSDGIDNDDDQTVDCADQSCYLVQGPENANGFAGKCSGGSEFANPADYAMWCGDDYDNDADGLVDCQDTDCADQSCGTGCLCSSNEKHEIDCFDGIDNDLDYECSYEQEPVYDCTDDACQDSDVCDGDLSESWPIFVTQTKTDGTIEFQGKAGLAAADAICQEEADSYDSIVPKGVYKAIISDYQNNARARVMDGKFYNNRKDGGAQQIALSKDDLFDNYPLDATPAYDVEGNFIDTQVWTGSNANGLKIDISGYSRVCHCDWKSDNSGCATLGKTGSSSATGSDWISISGAEGDADCEYDPDDPEDIEVVELSLYCVKVAESNEPEICGYNKVCAEKTEYIDCDDSDCSDTLECKSGYCLGGAYSCSSFRFGNDCRSAPGCSWIELFGQGRCVGFGSSCDELQTSECRSTTDCTWDFGENCNNYKDDDFDDLIDCEDPDCDAECVEICGDGIDNDRDGDVDIGDDDCAHLRTCPQQGYIAGDDLNGQYVDFYCNAEYEIELYPEGGTCPLNGEPRAVGDIFASLFGGEDKMVCYYDYQMSSPDDVGDLAIRELATGDYADKVKVLFYSAPIHYNAVFKNEYLSYYGQDPITQPLLADLKIDKDVYCKLNYKPDLDGAESIKGIFKDEGNILTLNSPCVPDPTAKTCAMVGSECISEQIPIYDCSDPVCADATACQSNSIIFVSETQTDGSISYNTETWSEERDLISQDIYNKYSWNSEVYQSFSIVKYTKMTSVQLEYGYDSANVAVSISQDGTELIRSETKSLLADGQIYAGYVRVLFELPIELAPGEYRIETHQISGTPTLRYSNINAYLDGESDIGGGVDTDLVFRISGSEIDGDVITGIDAADARCQAEADANENLVDGKYVALLSTSTQDAKDIVAEGIFYNSKDEIISNSKSDLFNQDHINGVYRLDRIYPPYDIWTGSDSDGTYTASCNDWTDDITVFGGRVGAARSRDEVWISNAFGDCSTDVYYIYCVKVPEVLTQTEPCGYKLDEVICEEDSTRLNVYYDVLKAKQMDFGVTYDSDCAACPDGYDVSDLSESDKLVCQVSPVIPIDPIVTLKVLEGGNAINHGDKLNVANLPAGVYFGFEEQSKQLVDYTVTLTENCVFSEGDSLNGASKEYSGTSEKFSKHIYVGKSGETTADCNVHFEAYLGDQIYAESITFTLEILAILEDCDDGIDNDGDGDIDCADSSCFDDGNCKIICIDEDGDGYFANVALGCAADITQVDCDDGIEPDDCGAACNPGNIEEVCDNFDHNCDGDPWEDTRVSVYTDEDGDTWGIDGNMQICPRPEYMNGYATRAGDCNDNKDTGAEVNPAATESCDGIDNNCDDQIDEGFTFSDYYLDSDGDGFGNIEDSLSLCKVEPGRVLDSTDCNDARSAINPAQTEACSNGVDDDCTMFEDCLDISCTSSPACKISSETDCTFYESISKDTLSLDVPAAAYSSTNGVISFKAIIEPNRYIVGDYLLAKPTVLSKIDLQFIDTAEASYPTEYIFSISDGNTWKTIDNFQIRRIDDTHVTLSASFAPTNVLHAKLIVYKTDTRNAEGYVVGFDGIDHDLRNSFDFYKCTSTCVSDCSITNCGLDNCGRSCGTCTDGDVCSDVAGGNCVNPPNVLIDKVYYDPAQINLPTTIYADIYNDGGVVTPGGVNVVFYDPDSGSEPDVVSIAYSEIERNKVPATVIESPWTPVNLNQARVCVIVTDEDVTLDFLSSIGPSNSECIDVTVVECVSDDECEYTKDNSDSCGYGFCKEGRCAEDEHEATTYYLDNDDDKYGTPDVSIETCKLSKTQEGHYVTNSDDCNDYTDKINLELTCDAYDVCGTTESVCAKACPQSPAEICDGLDNDCDNVIDNGFDDLTATCYVGVGECLDKGKKICSSDGLGYACDATALLPTKEICNDVDDDCDGEIDEFPLACECEYGDTRICGLTSAGECTKTEQSCREDGTYPECSPVLPDDNIEECNGVDDDCNGDIDDIAAKTCFNACFYGTQSCLAGVWTDCNAPPPPDSYDMDCNNEKFGVCYQEGKIDCNGNCDAPFVYARGELCNGLDEDCDGEIDNGYNLGAECTVGKGICQRTGVKICDPNDLNDWMCSVDYPAPEYLIEQLDHDTYLGYADNRQSFVLYKDTILHSVELFFKNPEKIDAVSIEQSGQKLISTTEYTIVSTESRGSWVSFNLPITLSAGEYTILAEDPSGLSNIRIATTNPYADGSSTWRADADYAFKIYGAIGVVTSRDETCDGLDNDCDGEIDEGVKTTFYKDVDGDGYGDVSNSVEACDKPDGYVTDSTDCDDTKGNIFPNAAETCDGEDNNCNFQIDEELARECSTDCGTGTETCSMGLWINCDADLPPDNYDVECDNGELGLCNQPGKIQCDGTCDAPAGEPHQEICGNGEDEDCDGEDAVCWELQDDDGDGMSEEQGDCDDSDPDVYLGATEYCNGVDDNCNNIIDSDSWDIGEICYSSGTGACSTEGVKVCETDTQTKCNAVEGSPTAEICEDGIDQNCDGSDAACASECVAGDADCNGNINILDAMKVVNYILKQNVVCEQDNIVCDYDGNGKINILDVSGIVNLILAGGNL